MRRFADTHGFPAAIVLISGDINFASDLCDLRHRYGTSLFFCCLILRKVLSCMRRCFLNIINIYSEEPLLTLSYVCFRKKLHIILLHNSACSIALILCANEHYNFDQFVLPIPSRGMTKVFIFQLDYFLKFYPPYCPSWPKTTNSLWLSFPPHSYFLGLFSLVLPRLSHFRSTFPIPHGLFSLTLTYFHHEPSSFFSIFYETAHTFAYGLRCLKHHLSAIHDSSQMISKCRKHRKRKGTSLIRNAV